MDYGVSPAAAALRACRDSLVPDEEPITATEAIENRERYARALGDDLERAFDRLFDEALGRAFGFVAAPPLPAQELTVAMLVEAARWLNERTVVVDDPLDIDPRFQVAPRRPLEDLVQSVLDYEGLDEEDENERDEV